MAFETTNDLIAAKEAIRNAVGNNDDEYKRRLEVFRRTGTIDTLPLMFSDAMEDNYQETDGTI